MAGGSPDDEEVEVEEELVEAPQSLSMTKAAARDSQVWPLQRHLSLSYLSFNPAYRLGRLHGSAAVIKPTSVG
jgi:hypothetical protein